MKERGLGGLAPVGCFQSILILGDSAARSLRGRRVHIRLITSIPVNRDLDPFDGRARAPYSLVPYSLVHPTLSKPPSASKRHQLNQK